MKILHILDHSIPLHSGYTFRTRAILEEQRKLGWQTFHITSAKHVGARAPIETFDGLDFYRSPDPVGIMANLPILNQWAIIQSLEKRLEEIVHDIKPDILHAHSPALNGIAALKISKRYRIPLVYECRAFWEDAAVDHGTTKEGSIRYRLTHALESYVFKHADAITTICEGLRNDIITRGISGEKITVIPNAVDIDKFNFKTTADDELIEKYQLRNCTVLGFIGSFYAYEGILLLLDALPKILAIHPNIRLLLVGGGPQLKQIKNKISELNLQNIVIMPGRVAHDLVPRYYGLVDIFIYPRLTMRLTELVTPLKPLEAMAQGKLVVASDVGGHRELIRDQKTGYLFKANNTESLAQTVLTVIENKDNWQAIRFAGRDYVENERNWKNSVANYQSIYLNLTE